MKILRTLLPLAALAVLGTACASTGDNSGQSAEFWNPRCPIMADHEIDPAVSVEFEGRKVGFCCDGCIEDFDAMSRDQKMAALKKAGATME